MNSTKVLVATLFTLIILFIMFAISMPVAKSDEHWEISKKDIYEPIKNQWETSTYINEVTNQIEKRLVYFAPKLLGPRILFVVPCDNNERVAIEIAVLELDTYFYRPEWYYPRGKVRVRLNTEYFEWEVIKPEGSSNWLYITTPSTTQVVQQLKEHDVLGLYLLDYAAKINYGAKNQYVKYTKIKLVEFGKLYDSHCG